MRCRYYGLVSSLSSPSRGSLGVSRHTNTPLDILMDGPPAQSLGVEPVDPRIMTLPPRPRNARVLTKPLIRRVLTSAFLIMLGTLAIYVYEMGDDDPLSLLSRSTSGHKSSSSRTV